MPKDQGTLKLITAQVLKKWLAVNGVLSNYTYEHPPIEYLSTQIYLELQVEV